MPGASPLRHQGLYQWTGPCHMDYKRRTVQRKLLFDESCVVLLNTADGSVADSSVVLQWSILL